MSCKIQIVKQKAPEKIFSLKTQKNSRVYQNRAQRSAKNIY